MAIFQNAYDALPESRFIKRGLIARQRKAEKLIYKAPNTAKGYLDLAKTFIEQNNLRAALEVYDRGIESITSSLNSLIYANKKSIEAPEYDTSFKTPQQKTNTLYQSLRKSKKTDENNGSIIADQQHDLSILKMERQSILATLVQHSQRFHQSLPYDILYAIFGYLDDFEDLWQCGSTCKRWRHFMITWPPFWNKLSPSKTSLEDKSTVFVADRHKSTHTICLNGPFNPNIKLIDIFDALQSVADDNSIEKLYFKKIKFKEHELDALATALESMKGPSFKHVEFIDCDIPDQKLVTPFLKSCSNLTTIIYKEKNNGPDGRCGGLNCNYLKEPIKAFPFLTYLKIFIGLSTYGYYNRESKFKTLLFADMLVQCPNLMHLFLDAREAKIYLGRCAATVFKYCPLLKNVVLGNNAEMPETITTDIDEHEFIHGDNDFNTTETQLSEHPVIDSNNDNNYKEKLKSSSNNAATQSTTAVLSTNKSLTISEKLSLSTTSKGLRRFIILNSHLIHYYTEHDSKFQISNRNEWANCFSAFNQLNRDSLELLYVPYNITTVQGLHKWCDRGIIASSLRELHLSSDTPRLAIMEEHIGSIDKNGILGKMVPLLPALEVISIKQSHVCGYYSFPKPRPFYDERHLFVDDDVLNKLIKYCRRIRYIKIVGYPLFTSEAVLSLAKSGYPDSNPFSKKLPITYLEMDIQRDIVLPLVKEMRSLKELKVRMDRHNTKELDPMTPTDQQETSSILNERGGSLTVTNGHKRDYR
ncbi:hypothetical protein BDA99DRAFT_531319 [Phascolomyces articulosus]|uniref:F-box domain-containing protein n=1 Tax=Phascolomyces articulosus TaxID=60185 RepID=A0AAD5KCR3_9FUNG|nr:hypothetical protein BDA99DRAFT_531319 [Phascolomyces articulosus]